MSNQLRKNDLSVSKNAIYSFSGQDRFGNSALFITGGYLQTSTTFKDFTLIGWIFLDTMGSFRLFSLNALSIDVRQDQNQLYLILIENNYVCIISSISLPYFQWFHVSIVVKNLVGFVYLNGIQVGVGILNSSAINFNDYSQPENKIIEYNDFKFYSGTVDSTYILNDFNSNSPASLQNEWTMMSLNDIVGGMNIMDATNYNFTMDRFNLPLLAINLKNGFLKVPPRIYFNKDFTITAWIQLYSYQPNLKIIDFSNNGTDRVAFGLDETGYQLQSDIHYLNSNFTLKASLSLNLNNWLYIAYVLQGLTGSIYVNGQLVANGSQNIPRSVIRTTNFIGKNILDNTNSSATFDDIRIYKGALRPVQILNNYIGTSIINLYSKNAILSPW